MKDVKRTEDSEEAGSPNKKQLEAQEDIDFMLWKEELNKELVPFWRALEKI
jgi:hypothetical protein